MPRQLFEMLKQKSERTDSVSIQEYVDTIISKHDSEQQCYFRVVRMGLERQVFHSVSSDFSDGFQQSFL